MIVIVIIILLLLLLSLLLLLLVVVVVVVVVVAKVMIQYTNIKMFLHVFVHERDFHSLRLWDSPQTKIRESPYSFQCTLLSMCHCDHNSLLFVHSQS